MMSFDIETAVLLVLACALGLVFGMALRRRAHHRRRISILAQTTFLPLAESGPGIDAAVLRGEASAPAADEVAPLGRSSTAQHSSTAPEAPLPSAVPPTPSSASPMVTDPDSMGEGPAAGAGKPTRRAGSRGRSVPPASETLAPSAVAEQPSLFALPPRAPAIEPGLPGQRPPTLPQPGPDGADDLKVLKGIGPLNERKLNALGIYHFHQIAAWTPEEARWIGAALGFRGRIEREDWIGQARALVPVRDAKPDDQA